MTNSCRLFGTEYSRNYIKRKLTPVESFIPRDYFAERIEEGEIDPRVASIPTKLDEAAEQLVYKHVLDYQRSVYQVSYKNHWAPLGKEQTEKDKSETETKGKDFESELLTYIQDLYHDPHEEKILAPPVTTKRIFGYIRPKLLHGSLSMYQDTFGRTGATVMLQERDKKLTTTSKETATAETKVKKNDPCAVQNDN